MYKVISYYTPKYRLTVEPLLQSLIQYEMPYEVTEVPDKGNWTENTYYKPYYIREQLDRHDCDLIWLDADAELVAYPEYFDIIKEDLGIYVRRRSQLYGEVVSSVIYLKNCKEVKELVDWWIKSEEKDTMRGHLEQYHLERAVLEHFFHRGTVTLFYFPDRYAVIDGITTSKEPVICQHQASRQFR